MSDSSANLRVALLELVDDLEELEVLLCVREQGGRKGLGFEAIMRVVSFTRPAVRGALERLAARGLISCTAIEPAVYRFDPQSARMGETFTRIAAAYRDNPLEVMRLMSAIAVERVRTAAAKRFS